jgi:hypothetical protein
VGENAWQDDHCDSGYVSVDNTVGDWQTVVVRLDLTVLTAPVVVRVYMSGNTYDMGDYWCAAPTH